MMRPLASCDYSGYCNNKHVPSDEISDWFEISVSEADDRFSLVIKKIGELAPLYTSLLACSASHAEIVTEKEIDKFLYGPGPVPEIAPAAAPEPESDIPF
jgi:hypothetical protein